MTMTHAARLRRGAAAALLAAALGFGAGLSGAAAQTKITIGNVAGNAGFFIPTYVAHERGFFAKEGLSASFVAMSGKALVTAGITGAINFLPIPGGGSQAALKGAPIRFVVGEGISSQWVIVTKPEIQSVAALKGKTIGYGRPGGADYDEGEIVLHRFFDMDIGRDYKVISLAGESDRLAALFSGHIDAALVTIPHAAKAQLQGYKPLLRVGDYLPRVGGTVWVNETYMKNNRPTVKKFIRAMAGAIEYFRHEKDGSVAVLQNRFGIADPKEAGFLWDQLHDQYSPDIPEALLKRLFNSRVERMISGGLWEKGKTPPDPEQFVERALLTETLREMGYYLKAPPKK